MQHPLYGRSLPFPLMVGRGIAIAVAQRRNQHLRQRFRGVANLVAVQVNRTATNQYIEPRAKAGTLWIVAEVAQSPDHLGQNLLHTIFEIVPTDAAGDRKSPGKGCIGWL